MTVTQIERNRCGTRVNHDSFLISTNGRGARATEKLKPRPLSRPAPKLRCAARIAHRHTTRVRRVHGATELLGARSSDTQGNRLLNYAFFQRLDLQCTLLMLDMGLLYAHDACSAVVYETK